MIENDFRDEVIASARKRGGMGWILTDKFRKGRPDLLVKMPQRQIYIAECKMVKYVRPPVQIPVDTTALQKIELCLLQRCEVIAPALVCLLVDKRPPVCYTVWDINAEYINVDEYDGFKSVRGEKKDWDIEQIIYQAERGKEKYGITIRRRD
jgi:hypothetical protein